MKNKIKRISKGNFEVVQPEIQFSETKIVMRIGEGEQYEGSFTIQNELDGDIRGLVYPSSFRVSCKEQGFEGNPVEIHYIFDGSGMLPGDVEKGRFSVVCNGGEFTIPFTAVVEKPFVMTRYGKVQNIREFKTLAMEDFAEAKTLFRSRRFGELLKYEDSRVTSLYSNMRKWALDDQALEEFLVGTGQKERIRISFQEEELRLEHQTETSKDSVTVTKNTWGYLPARIETEGGFLRVEKNFFTTEDFIGTNYFIEYVIDTGKLHAGYNFGKITLVTPYERKELPVVVHQQSVHTKHHGEEAVLFGTLLKSYMACVSGKMELRAWTEQAVDLVKQLRELAPKNEFYELLMAHVFLRGGQMEEAKWFLENYNYNRFVIGKKTEVNSYYLFLTGMMRKEDLLVKKIVEDLNKNYAKHPSSWKLLCMLLNLDPKFRSYGERLPVLRERFANGESNVLLYIEAYICYQEKSSLLKKLGEFELRILNFAAKYHIITKELALYTASLATQEKMYNERLFHILTNAYDMYEDPMILTAVCTQLVKGNKTGKSCFPWYQKAVEMELKIARLYEYYMMSADTERVTKPLPRSVVLYFAHGTSLDYKKTAFLYANVLTYEDETSELYLVYSEKIERFAWEQLMKCHINENLRIIYTRFCSGTEVSLEQMKAIYDISHAYHVQTKAPDMQYVLVLEKDGTISQRVACTEEGAQVFLYHKSSRIIWETADGRHYTDSVPYESRRLFYEPQFVEMYEKKAAILRKTEEEQKVELDTDTLKQYGIDYFGERQVFRFCSKMIREMDDDEDDYLSYLCFELMKRGQYDRVTLNYLAEYYCGATYDMKQVWRTAREYEVKTYKLSERIVTQMLFSETMFREEDIFMDYYNSGPYFRLKLGYLAYVSEEYFVRNRSIKEEIMKIIIIEYKKGEILADVCKLAVLRFYSDRTSWEDEDVLKSFLHELCERQIVFPFYLKYKPSWLREVLLHDKVLIEYRAAEAGKVKLTYMMDCKEPLLQRQYTEQPAPMYADIYVKQFMLFDGEQIRYSFREYDGDRLVGEENGRCVPDPAADPVGKFGRLNRMGSMEKEELALSLTQYRLEENLAEKLFITY